MKPTTPKPISERLADAAELSSAAEADIAKAMWEQINHPTPLTDALKHIGEGLHRIADAMEAKSGD